MKRVILSWIRNCIRFVVSLLSQAIGQTRLIELVAETAKGDFVTYHRRPKLSAAVGTESDAESCIGKSLVVVIQGPIVHEDGFTLETVKIYQRHFAGARIILATWEDEPPSAIRRFEDLGITLILNAKPAYAGEGNLNLQIVSSRSGMRKAKELGVTYALKTRTDQRMYAPDIAEYLYNITRNFPVRAGWGQQRSRIIGCSLNTFKYRMYGLSDMLIYGHIDDMWLYWNVDLDSRVFTAEEERQACLSLRSFARWRVCEVYLATEFLSKVGRKLDWTLRDSWLTFADHFCVVDKEQIDLFWHKYNKREYRWLRYDKDARMQELCFREWLGLYTNLAAREIYENILDAPFV